MQGVLMQSRALTALNLCLFERVRLYIWVKQRTVSIACKCGHISSPYKYVRRSSPLACFNHDMKVYSKQAHDTWLLARVDRRPRQPQAVTAPDDLPGA